MRRSNEAMCWLIAELCMRIRAPRMSRMTKVLHIKSFLCLYGSQYSPFRISRITRINKFWVFHKNQCLGFQFPRGNMWPTNVDKHGNLLLPDSSLFRKSPLPSPPWGYNPVKTSLITLSFQLKPLAGPIQLQSGYNLESVVLCALVPGQHSSQRSFDIFITHR